MPGASHISNMPSFSRGPGPTLVDGGDLTNLYNILLGNKVGIVAGSGGGIANAVQLNTGVNEVNTVGAAADSLKLPAAISGSQVWVINNAAANSCSIYTTQLNAVTGAADVVVPHGTGTANAPTAATTLAAGHATLFVVSSLGKWKQVGDFA